jgi:hypothetical protein
MSDYPAVVTLMYADGEASVERFADVESLVEHLTAWLDGNDSRANDDDKIVAILRGDYMPAIAPDVDATR